MDLFPTFKPESSAWKEQNLPYSLSVGVKMALVLHFSERVLLAQEAYANNEQQLSYLCFGKENEGIIQLRAELYRMGDLNSPRKVNQCRGDHSLGGRLHPMRMNLSDWNPMSSSYEQEKPGMLEATYRGGLSVEIIYTDGVKKDGDMKIIGIDRVGVSGAPSRITLSSSEALAEIGGSHLVRMLLGIEPFVPTVEPIYMEKGMLQKMKENNFEFCKMDWMDILTDQQISIITGGLVIDANVCKHCYTEGATVCGHYTPKNRGYTADHYNSKQQIDMAIEVNRLWDVEFRHPSGHMGYDGQDMGKLVVISEFPPSILCDAIDLNDWRNDIIVIGDERVTYKHTYTHIYDKNHKCTVHSHAM